MDDLTAGTMARPRQVPNVMIGPESWTRLWSPACQKLMMAHRDEVGQADVRAPFDPDHERILALQNAGGLMVLGARYCDELVGYSIWYLVPSLESQGLIIAMQAPWYVAPEFRGYGVGMRLLNSAMLQLRQRGCKMLQGHLPLEGQGSDLWPVFARKGAKKIGTEFSLWLEP